MSIPLDRLYYYIDSIAEEVRGGPVIIYHFWPHGSKNVDNLVEFVNPLTSVAVGTSVTEEHRMQPRIICNDQEPLNFDLYTEYSGNLLPQLLDKSGPKTIHFTQSILLHSEQRSHNAEMYCNNQFIPVYYWSHAIIAQDWFRYAKYVTQKKSINQIFLVYNRAWSGTREYRLGFADRLIISSLVDQTLMRVSPVDSTINKHYDLHTFEQSHWRPHNVIEKYFPLCEAESHYSADFDIKDYESTEIEIVLETLFDDLRLHLTEKTLRPIAMGQPFILAGTYGSLKYLRDYGFKTFSDCWDESYDMMSDSLERMNKIIEVMGDIVSMHPDQRDRMLEQAREIAVYNKKHFFSKEFQNQIINELKTNLKIAYAQLTTKS
jgi:hypothetical protein